MSKKEEEVARQRAKDFGGPALTPSGSGQTKYTGRDVQHSRFSKNHDVAGIGQRKDELGAMRAGMDEGARQRSREGSQNLDKLETGRINAEKAGAKPTVKESHQGMLAENRRQDQAAKAGDVKQPISKEGMMTSDQSSAGKAGQGQGGMGAGASGPAPSGGQAKQEQKVQTASHADNVKARTEQAAKREQSTQKQEAQARRRSEMGPKPEAAQKQGQGQSLKQNAGVSQSAW